MSPSTELPTPSPQVPQGVRIFRPQAVERYARRGEETVFPQLVAPSVFAWLWLLLGLLGAGLLLAWGTRVPVYVAGSAVVAPGTSQPGGGPAPSSLVAFVDPSQRHRLAVGAQVWVSVDGRSRRWAAPIREVVAGSFSPQQAVARFHLPQAAACAVSGPSAAVLVSLDGAPEPPPGLAPGTVVRVQMEAGRRRLLGLLLGSEPGGGGE